MNGSSIGRRALLAGATLAPLATPALAQRAKSLRLGSPQPADSNYNRALVMFAEQVAKLSSNRLKVDVFANSQLGSIKEMLTAVQLGTLSMTLAVPAWYSGFVKPMDVFTLPFVVSTPARLRAAIDGPLGDAIKAKAEAANFHLLDTLLSGQRHMVNNLRPINVPQDVAGLKMRVIASPVYIAMFKALSANPVAIDSAEIYLSLQQKVVDGLEYPVPDMLDAKLNEVSKFYSLTGHTTDFFFVAANKPLWDGMSTEERGILTQAMRTASDWEWQAQPALIEKALERLGTMLQVNPVSSESREKFVQATKPVYAQFEPSIGRDILDLAIRDLGQA